MIENRGGASGMIGAEAAAKSPPDGYTFLLTPNAPLSVLPSLRKTPYDPVKSFDPVGRVGDVISGFVIHPSVGVKTFKEMVEYAKRTRASSPSARRATAPPPTCGSRCSRQDRHRHPAHSLPRRRRYAQRRAARHRPHDERARVAPHVKAGKLILLNINGSARHPDFPDVPTLTELGITGADVPIWFSIFAPAGTPKDIIAKLNAKMIEIAKTDDMKAKMLAVNAFVPLQTPEDMAKHLIEDIEANAELIKAANIKID